MLQETQWKILEEDKFKVSASLSFMFDQFRCQRDMQGHAG